MKTTMRVLGAMMLVGLAACGDDYEAEVGPETVAVVTGERAPTPVVVGTVSCGPCGDGSIECTGSIHAYPDSSHNALCTYRH